MVKKNIRKSEKIRKKLQKIHTQKEEEKKSIKKPKKSKNC